MPAVLLSAMLALCPFVGAQGPSPSAEPVPAIALHANASTAPASMQRTLVAEPRLESSEAEISVPQPESALSRGFSVAEAGILLLVGTCMVWVGFAKRRNSPPRRVVR